MEITEFILIFLTLLIGWSVFKLFLTPKNLPPGPLGLPFIGYLPFLGKNPQVTVANLRHKYGDIIRVDLAFMDVIVLSSFDVVKEAFVKQADVISNRHEYFTPPIVRTAPGLVNSSGELWSEFRRFTFSTLKGFGFGKSSLEPKIHSEIYYFIQEIKSFNGKPAPVDKFLRLSVTNVICVVMFGMRYEYDDPIFNKLLHLTEEHVNLLKTGVAQFLIPYALQKPWFMRLLGTKSITKTASDFRSLIAQIVDTLEKDYKQGSVDNFINAWFTESEKLGSKQQNFSKEQLMTVLMDLFVTGSDTSAVTLSWSVLYMVKYPEIQAKVQNEIDDVIGRERTPSMTDLRLMPFTEATLMEVNRIASITPLGVPHSTAKDTTLNGFFIPKNSIIVSNLWAIHHDPNIFSNPFDFNPQRFLTDDLQVKRVEELIPFSIGKRQCMGESLARMELFLYFTSMLQHFTFTRANGVEVNLDYEFALVTPPKRQLIGVVAR